MKINFVNKKIIILFLIFINICHANDQGVIYIERYLGLLGNQLYQFCLGKILSKELNFKLYCPPIYGFPETYLYNTTVPSSTNKLPSEMLTGHVIDFENICKNKSPRKVVLQGIFSRYEYYKKYTNEIKKWLRFEQSVHPHPNSNDIVMHIRINNSMANYMYLPPSYYEKALSLTPFNQLYICTNEPNDPYLKHFAKYKPIIKSTISLNQLMNQGKSYNEIIQLTLEEFKFITSFNKIITAQSTFSWWAAFLSDAQEIFAPLPSTGIMSLGRPDIQMTGIEESRYTYIAC